MTGARKDIGRQNCINHFELYGGGQVDRQTEEVVHQLSGTKLILGTYVHQRESYGV